MTKSEIWIHSEWVVARDRVLKRGESLIRHRFQTPFAEIDLLTRCEVTKTLRMIEVKSSFGVQGNAWLADEYLPFAISRSQRLRLSRAFTWIESQVSHPLELTLAVVSHSDNQAGSLDIQYFDLDGEDY